MHLLYPATTVTKALFRHSCFGNNRLVTEKMKIDIFITNVQLFFLNRWQPTDTSTDNLMQRDPCIQSVVICREICHMGLKSP